MISRYQLHASKYITFVGPVQPDEVLVEGEVYAVQSIYPDYINLVGAKSPEVIRVDLDRAGLQRFVPYNRHQAEVQRSCALVAKSLREISQTNSAAKAAWAERQLTPEQRAERDRLSALSERMTQIDKRAASRENPTTAVPPEFETKPESARRDSMSLEEKVALAKRLSPKKESD